MLTTIASALARLAAENVAEAGEAEDAGELLDPRPPIVVPLSSQCISRAEYRPRTMVMILTMRRGGEVFEYADVPASIFTGLITARSAGAFYNANIREHFSAP